MQVTAEMRMKRITTHTATHSERLYDGCAYQWPLQPLLLLDLKVTHRLLSSAAFEYKPACLPNPILPLNCTTILMNVHSIYNQCRMFKCSKIITTHVLQLWASKLVNSHKHMAKKMKHLMSRDCFDAKKLFYKLCRTEHDIALWYFIPTFLRNKAPSQICLYIQCSI